MKSLVVDEQPFSGVLIDTLFDELIQLRTRHGLIEISILIDGDNDGVTLAVMRGVVHFLPANYILARLPEGDVTR